MVGKLYWGPIRELREAQGLDAPEEPPDKFRRWAVTIRGKGYSPNDGAVAHVKFLRDPDFREKRWPLAVFLNPNVYQSRLPPLERRGREPTPLERELRLRLEPLRAEGHAYAVHQLLSGLVEPVAISGEKLQVRACDRFAWEWTDDHYSEDLKRLSIELLPKAEAAA